MSAIATEIFGAGVTFDEEHDRLRSAPQPESQAFGTARPPQFERRPLSEIVPPRAVPKTTAKPQPAWPRRPGWAS